MRTKGYKCSNVKCGSCVAHSMCGEPAEIALGCANRMVSTTTNADRIRSMSDEELANMLTDFSNNGGWVTETGREICYERHIEWLKHPAE